MFKITNNYIYHTKGDTGGFDVNVCVDALPIPYNLYTGKFSVKRDLDDVGYVLQKDIVNGHIDIAPEDTLNIPAGEYWYDIELYISDSNGKNIVDTFGPYHYRLVDDVTR